MRVTAVVLSWNGRQDTLACLRSLALVPRAVLERVGPFDEALFALSEDVDWSLRARAAGVHVLVVPGSIVWHRVSAASGGESSPTTLYYGLRNSLAVAERHAPLGRGGTWLRRGEALASHLAQAALIPRPHRGVRRGP